MFVRNGQALGSVLHSAALGAEPAEPEEEPTPEPEKDAGRPKDYDTKADWVAYAVAVDDSLSEEDAEAMTKAELVDKYGG